MAGASKWLGCGVFLFLVRCSDGAVTTPPPIDASPDVPQPHYTLEQLKDPETCNACHKKHYQEWSGSMHAYAADDPLFLAMNEQGQREANIGNFCVNCHAPMAVASADAGTVIDTATLKALPKSQRGVTCYFCHSIESVSDTHNNPLRLASDGVMRGRFTDAVPNEAHASAYSAYLDGTQLQSASACGSCHDIVNDRNAHIERTFAEWKGTVFSMPVTGVTCAQCHVQELQKALIADGPKVQGVFARLGHAHTMAAVDTALTEFPQIAAQKVAVAAELNRELQTALCVTLFGTTSSRIAVLADNIAAGHKWPSGAAQDRQLWFEVTAYAGGQPIYQSGSVPAGADPTESTDPDLWLVRDCMFDEQGKETHLFWETKTYDSNALPGQLTLNPMLPEFYQSHVARGFPAGGASTAINGVPDRVTLKVWLQAFPYKVFDELNGEFKGLGYDDAQIAAMRAKLAPVQLSTHDTPEISGYDLEWTADAVADKMHGGQEFRNGLVPVLPAGVWVQCVTGTSMKASVQNVHAPAHMTCKP